MGRLGAPGAGGELAGQPSELPAEVEEGVGLLSSQRPGERGGTTKTSSRPSATVPWFAWPMLVAAVSDYQRTRITLVFGCGDDNQLAAQLRRCMHVRLLLYPTPPPHSQPNKYLPSLDLGSPLAPAPSPSSFLSLCAAGNKNRRTRPPPYLQGVRCLVRRVGVQNHFRRAARDAGGVAAAADGAATAAGRCRAVAGDGRGAQAAQVRDRRGRGPGRGRGMGFGRRVVFTCVFFTCHSITRVGSF